MISDVSFSLALSHPCINTAFMAGSHCSNARGWVSATDYRASVHTKPDRIINYNTTHVL